MSSECENASGAMPDANVNAAAMFAATEMAVSTEADDTATEGPEGASSKAASVTVYNDFDIDDPRFERERTITRGKDRFDKKWKPETIPLWQLLEELGKHKEGKKDGRAVVLARMVKGQRLDKSVIEITGIGFDDDSGTPSDEIDEKIAASGYLAVRYSTHSHNKTTTDIPRDALYKFAPDADCITDDDAVIPDGLIRDYCRKLGWAERIVASASFSGRHHTDDGPVIRIHHVKMPKHRVVLFLAESFVIAREGKTMQEAKARWKKLYLALAQKLGLTRIDKTGADINRLFNLPRHDRGADCEVSVFGGEFVDWRKFETEGLAYFEALADAAEREFKSGSKTKTEAGRELIDWWNARANGFQIVTALENECSDCIRGTASGSRITITCPFESDHSEQDAGDSACFAVNATDDGYEECTVKCLHNSCANKTTLDHIGKMKADGLFGDDVLWNPDYDVVERLTAESVKEACEALRKDDAKETAAGVQAILDKIKEEPNDTLRSTLFATSKQNIKDRALHPLVTEAKKAAWKAWQEKRRANRLTRAAAVGAEVFEFANEDDLVKTLNARCQVAPYGDEMRYVFHDEKTGAFIFRKKKDAENALAPYRLWVKGEKSDKEVDGFYAWNKNAGRHEYKRVVFNPNKNDVDPDELNLWRGWAIKPTPGDWSLMRTHIRDNICQGNEEHFNFLMAVVAQTFQEPERKIGIVVVLRGLKGVGKTIFVEWLVEIVGPHHAVIADKGQQVTGKFNAQLRYNILVAAEEAFFAGDPQMRGPLKHLATGRTLSIEAKGRDIVQERNYTRIFITTNEDWAVPAEPGERRLFVLDVGDDCIRNGPYFDAITEQMRHGGAAAMLHDMLEYDYSAVDFANMPMTEALASQIRHGLDAPKRWLESMLVEGSLPFRDGARSGTELGGKEVMIAKDDVVASFCEYVPSHASRPTTPQDVGTFLYKNVPGLREAKGKKSDWGPRPRYLVFPPLDSMRAEFLRANPGYKFAAQPVESPDAAGVDADQDTDSSVVQFPQKKGA